jgi:tol-pal system protein YbgF
MLATTNVYAEVPVTYNVYNKGNIIKTTGEIPVQTNISTAARLELRLNQLEDQLRSMNGRLETVEFQNRMLQKKLNGKAENAPAVSYVAPSNNVNQQAIRTDVKSALVLPAGDDIVFEYDKAHLLLRKSEYAEAERLFHKFVTENPDHKLTANAYYWLGETLSANQKYEQAAVFFLRSYKQDAKGSKAPDSLLKLAVALVKLDKIEESCASLMRLKKEYPNVSQFLKQRVDILLSNNECK